MNHDIVIDENGNEHQAVIDRGGCISNQCSMNKYCATTSCTSDERADKKEVIYKRKVTIEEYINAKQNG